jgi:N-acetylglutamate synthase-like GNAT family acetyltransferase
MVLDDNPRGNVRAATRADLDWVVEFLKRYVAAQQLLPRTIDELLLLFPNGFIAEFEGRPVGFAALEVYSDKLAEIRSLAVDAEMRGKGLGKLLVQACIEKARELGVFEVMAVTASETLFQACGFDFTLPGQKKALFIQTRDAH